MRIKGKKAIALFLSLLMGLLVFPSGTAAIAEAGGTSYYDPTLPGEQTAETVTPVTAEETEWTDGWYLVEDMVTATERYTVSGAVNLILADGAELIAEQGITVPDGSSLTIWAQSPETNPTVGKLKAAGKIPQNSAAIGGGDNQTNGAITINGGNITATATYYEQAGGFAGAGIGGGNGQIGKNITINGGSVTATGGTGSNRTGGAGIGGGAKSGGRDIRITGGTVNAAGGLGGAGIGGGAMANTLTDYNGDITIEGGVITAKGGAGSNSSIQAAGIGIGSPDPNTWSSTGTIYILGGTVTAVSTGSDTGALKARGINFNGTNSRGEYMDYLHMVLGNKTENTASDEAIEWSDAYVPDWESAPWTKVVPMTVTGATLELEKTEVTLVNESSYKDYNDYDTGDDNDVLIDCTSCYISAEADGKTFDSLYVPYAISLEKNHADGQDWFSQHQSRLNFDEKKVTIIVDEHEMSPEFDVVLSLGGQEDRESIIVHQPDVTLTIDPDNGEPVRTFTGPRYSPVDEESFAPPTSESKRFIAWCVHWYDAGSEEEQSEPVFEDFLNALRCDATVKATWKEGPAPVIEGVEDGGYYNGPRTVTVTDNVDEDGYEYYFVTVNGSPFIDDQELWNEEAGCYKFELKNEGTYQIFVADDLGNVTTVTATIDMTAPEISSSSKLKDGGVYCKHLSGTYTETLKRVTVNGVEMGLGYQKNGFTMISGSMNKPQYGKLTIVAEDLAGNTNTVTVTLNEDHTYVETNHVDARCNQRGSIKYACKYCDIGTKYVDLGFAEHQFGDGEVTREPTCTEEGVMTYTCTVCNEYEKTEAIPALGHQYGDQGEVAHEPTCTEDGVMTYHCTRANDGDKTEAIPATGHKDADGDSVCDVCGSDVEHPSIFETFTCKMCDSYNNLKDQPIAGVIARIVHFFVHIAYYFSSLT